MSFRSFRYDVDLAWWRFRRKVANFFEDYKLYLLSALFAIAGLIASYENVTWLMIVGGVLSYLIRALGFYFDDVLEQGSSGYYYRLPLWSQSTATLLIVSVIGMLVSHFLLEKPYLTGFLLSFNASLILFYVFWIIYLLILWIKMKLYWRKELKNRRRRKKDEDDDD